METKKDENWLAMAEEGVRDAHRRREYRPTVVALIRNKRDHVLLVRSAKDARTWYFPQGGIEEGESLITAFYREVFEEVRITAPSLVIARYRGVADIPAERERADKRGFSKGKRYFTIEALYEGSSELKLQTEEIDDFVWARQERVLAITQYAREEKRRFMLGLIGIASDC